MATEYSLELATELKPTQVLQLLADELTFEWADATHLLGPGLWVSVIEKGEVGQEIIEESFGFRPTIVVGFRLQPETSEDEKAARQMLLRATMFLLRKAPGDAILLLNGEHTRLQRMDGHLVLNSEWGELASYSLFSEVTLPYKMRNLPSPLLQ